MKINSRNTMEDHGGGRNTLHGVITELTTAPLKITYAGWELFGTSCPELRFRCHQTMNWRISSRTAIRAFATATTSLRMMINRLIIRFSSKTGGNHRCLLIHCLSQQLSRIVRCRVTSSCQSTEYSTTCLSSQDFKIVHTRRYGKSRIASQLHD